MGFWEVLVRSVVIAQAPEPSFSSKTASSNNRQLRFDMRRWFIGHIQHFIGPPPRAIIQELAFLTFAKVMIAHLPVYERTARNSPVIYEIFCHLYT